MYRLKVPFKDFKGNPRNATVEFNLTEREVFKLLPQLQRVLEWQESLKDKDQYDLDTAEVINYYNDFEEILLTAWGQMSDDGLHFRKAGRYEFEESALFNACMVIFVTQPEETGKLIAGIMPTGMEELVRKADSNLQQMQDNPQTTEELQRELAKLRAQTAAQELSSPASE